MCQQHVTNLLEIDHPAFQLDLGMIFVKPHQQCRQKILADVMRNRQVQMGMVIPDSADFAVQGRLPLQCLSSEFVNSTPNRRQLQSTILTDKEREIVAVL